MNPFTLEIKLIIGAVIVAALVGSGIWFRGVLADNTEMKTEIAAQKEEIANVTAEVERMNTQAAKDHALFTQVESRKGELAAELSRKLRELKKAKEALDAATQNCFDLVLPDSYLDRLPQAPDPVHPGAAAVAPGRTDAVPAPPWQHHRRPHFVEPAVGSVVEVVQHRQGRHQTVGTWPIT